MLDRFGAHTFRAIVNLGEFGNIRNVPKIDRAATPARLHLKSGCRISCYERIRCRQLLDCSTARLFDCSTARFLDVECQTAQHWPNFKERLLKRRTPHPKQPLSRPRGFRRRDSKTSSIRFLFASKSENKTMPERPLKFKIIILTCVFVVQEAESLICTHCGTKTAQRRHGDGTKTCCWHVWRTASGAPEATVSETESWPKLEVEQGSWRT